MKPCAAALLCISVLACKVDKPKPIIHRIQAGTPDSDGWITANHANGHFSVRVPIPFNEFSIEDANPSAPVSKSETIGCKSSEGIKFSATKVSYKMKGRATDIFAQFKSGSAVPGGVVSVSTNQGTEIVDIQLTHSSSNAHQRIFCLDETIMTLIVEWPTQEDALAKKLVPTFINSFKIIK